MIISYYPENRDVLYEDIKYLPKKGEYYGRKEYNHSESKGTEAITYNS
jgi:hypothetical protein